MDFSFVSEDDFMNLWFEILLRENFRNGRMYTDRC